MRRIAVTGGIAEGKSTVLGDLRAAGYEVGSADEVGREVFQSPGVQSTLSKLLESSLPISPEFLRSRLDEPALRRAVNALMHPLILAGLKDRPWTFTEVPLLIETCLQGEFDKVWVVTCGAQLQLDRLTARLGDEGAARKLIGTQLASRAKIPFADFVVRTNRDQWDVKRSVTVAAQRDLR